MKRLVQVTVLGLVMCGGILQSFGALTNYVETVNIALIASKNGARPAVITTKSVLTALGHTNATAQLLFKQSGSSKTFIVREGHTNTDVSGHFSRTIGGVVVTSTTAAGTTSTSVDTFHFEGTSLTFDATGLAVETTGKASATGPTVSKLLSIKGAGEGIVGAGGSNNAIVTGTVSLGAGRLE
jgi:hypothetical protein